MSETGSKNWSIVIAVALVVMAVGLIWLGAAHGPLNDYETPSLASKADEGAEVYVGGKLISTPARPEGKTPVFVLEDADGDGPHVRVEYTGTRKLAVDEGEILVFRGTVKHEGYIVSNRLVDVPMQAASHATSTTP